MSKVDLKARLISIIDANTKEYEVICRITSVRPDPNVFVNENNVIALYALVHAVQSFAEGCVQLSNLTAKCIEGEYPNIPWAKIRGAKNIIVHQYSTFDVDEIVKTAYKDVPKTQEALQQIKKDIIEEKLVAFLQTTQQQILYQNAKEHYKQMAAKKAEEEFDKKNIFEQNNNGNKPGW